MSNSHHEFSLRTLTSINQIPKQDWDQLSGTVKSYSKNSQSNLKNIYNPFINHDFLSSLEQSNSVSRLNGWMPQHLILSNSEGEISGAIPAYIKSHSQGEYVFDHSWANALEQAGGQYYPKLQCSLPFTPVTGPRLLTHQNQKNSLIKPTLAKALCQLTDQLHLSSAHITFMLQDEAELLKQQGFLIRHDQQFHFQNEGYDHYNAFLDNLSSRKRKALRKERRIALENDIVIDWLTGLHLTENIWDIFYQFYIDTSSRKWGRPYLTRTFFSLIGERMADDILLIMAKRNGRYIAGAINFIGPDCLYGRHWGCIEDHPSLHFEICYHQAIDFAIAHKLLRVEAGAQGQHKLARGYLPSTTYSAHYIPHEGFRHAIADYLEHERKEVGDIHEILKTHAPFKVKNT